MKLKNYIPDELSYFQELRRWFHAHPEESLKEYKTAEKIETELDKLDIPHTRVGATGVYAVIHGKAPGHIIALRGDIDALCMQDLKDTDYRSQNDGLCHACGHDSHAAALLTAAKILQSLKDTFNGEIRLFFQQAEEIGQGARQFVKAGLLDGVERVYGSHCCSGLPKGTISITPGPNNASCDRFTIAVHGKGAHVSTPHLGQDALYASTSIVNALQQIVARNTDPLDPVLIGIGILRSGTAYNIVANEGYIQGTTRCFSQETRTKTNQRIAEIAELTAKAANCTIDITFEDFAAPLVNDKEVCAEVSETANDIFDTIVTDREKSLGADDFADYLQVTKGCYAFIGTSNENDPNTHAPHHHGLFDLDEEAMTAAAELYAGYALNYLR